MMKIIPAPLHGLLDYLVSVLFILAPSMLGFSGNKDAAWVFIVLGIITIFYNLFTDYKPAVFRLIPMPVHLFLDMLSAICFIISPWLLGFHNSVFMPHLAAGVFEMTVVMLTQNGVRRRLNSRANFK